MVDLYALITTKFLTEPEKVGHGREGYYFAENGEYLHYDLAMAISKALYKLGAVESEEPARFVTEEEVQAGALKVPLLRRCERYGLILTCLLDRNASSVPAEQMLVRAPNEPGSLDGCQRRPPRISGRKSSWKSSRSSRSCTHLGDTVC